MSNTSFKYAKSLEKTDFKIGIAKSKWNDKYVDMLVDSAVFHLEQNNICLLYTSDAADDP